MGEKRFVPELRFPEFDDVWTQKKIEAEFYLISGQHLNPDEYTTKYSESLIPYFTGPSDFTNDQKELTKWSLKDGKVAQLNDILFTVKGSGVGTSMLLLFDKVAMGRQLMAIGSNTSSTAFLFPKLNSLRNYYTALASGNMIPGLSRDDILKTKLYFPSLPEQQKIATFLTSIDQRIQLLEKKKAKLEAYKKGVMQQIFSQEVRFKDETGNNFPDWEEKKLGEQCSFFSGGTPSSTNKSFYDGSIPFIGSGEISSDFTEKKITEEALENSSAKMVEFGDLLYALYGATSGEVAISKIVGAINQAVLCIRTKNLDKVFLFHLLSFSKEKIIKKYLQGGQGNLSAKIIRELKLTVPSSIREQHKIATFLFSIDKNIEQTTQQIEKSIGFKKGLLQKMFV